MNQKASPPWWKTSVMYEVLVPSFLDSDGDGMGDLGGVIQGLDYLERLGIGAVWLSPIYPSPMVDLGYDITDFCGINPRFGTFDDFDSLLADAHRRNMRIVLDLVPNHTSDEHPWFVESRSSRSNSYHDWYVWHDAAPDGSPPNNWLNRFGAGGWVWIAAVGQYYFCSFMESQPDLNWRNPAVREAMRDVMRFWLERGVDGFRVDALPHLLKDSRLRNNPVNPDYNPTQDPNDQQSRAYSQDQPSIVELIRYFRQVIDGFEDRVLVGEAYLAPPRIVTYGEAGLHFTLNPMLFQQPFEAPRLQKFIDTAEGIYPPEVWPNWSAGNHDLVRLADRIGEKNTPLAALLQLTLRGTPGIYYGDEIGMRQAHIPKKQMRDPSGVADPKRSRDPARTPMQWSGEANAGFTHGEPWLPLGSDYAKRNVAAQEGDPTSLLEFYRRLLHLRNAEPALQIGEYTPLVADPDAIVYTRSHEQDKFLIALNISGKEIKIDLENLFLPGQWQIVLSTQSSCEQKPCAGKMKLAAREGVLAKHVPQVTSGVV